MGLETILDNPGKLTLVGALVVAIFAFWKEWIVSGTAFTRCLNERDEFKQMLMSSLQITERIQQVRSSIK